MLRRLRRLLSPRPDDRFSGQYAPLEDAHPKDGLLAAPVRVAALQPREPERLDDGQVRVTFVATVRDAEDRRCPDLAVRARIVGPHRDGGGQSATDMMGAVRVRMVGPPGTYRCEITDVAAGGLAFDEEGSVLTAECEVAEA